MTDNEKYIELLKELGALISQKNISINMKDYQIDNLKQKLEVAEKEIENLRKEKK